MSDAALPHAGDSPPRSLQAGAADDRRALPAVAAALCLATLFVFAPLRHAEFVNYDDTSYLTENAHVRGGFTRAGVAWALAGFDIYWQPATWLSHMLDFQLFGLNAGGHHATSVLLHLANALLFLHVLCRLTGSLWPSAFVAALFAVHPLHVEPVAWISARNELLSTLFVLLSVLAYVRFTETRAAAAYAALCAGMLLALLSKGTAITLPALLLLLDYWPLRRRPAGPAASEGEPPPWRLVAEKAPLFALAAAGAALQVLAKRISGGLASLDAMPLSWRAANAAVAYGEYLRKMLWPTDLALPYPLLSNLTSTTRVVVSVLFLAMASVTVGVLGRRHRHLITGWLWYLLVLLPVIGLVQIGHQAMADRYTYLALNGVFVLVAWTASDLVRRRSALRIPVAVAAAAVLLLCVSLSRAQVAHWQDSIALFRHTTAVTEGNATAENNLGAALEAAGRTEEARAHYAEALRLDPIHPKALNNLGAALFSDGKTAEAEEYFRQLIRFHPNLIDGRLNFGISRLKEGDLAAAREQFEAVLRIDPANGRAHHGMAEVLRRENSPADGLTFHYAAMLEANRENPQAWNNLGVMRAKEGRMDEAEAHFREALRLRPAYAEARMNLALARLQRKDFSGAADQFAALVAADPGNGAAHLGLARALEGQGKADEARAQYAEALRLNPADDESRAAIDRLGGAAGR